MNIIFRLEQSVVETFNTIILKGLQVKSLQSLKEKEKGCGNRRKRTEDGERDIAITTHTLCQNHDKKKMRFVAVQSI